MAIVYKHTNRVNGKAYIGWSTLTIEERWQRHVLNAFTGVRTLFYNALRKYGQDVWDHEVLETHEDHESAKLAEVRLIALHNTYAFKADGKGYNMTPGGDGITGEVVISSNKNRILTIQSRLKMGVARRQRVTKDATKLLIAKSSKGRRFSTEHAVNHKLAAERRSVRAKNLRLSFEDQTVLLCGGPDRCGKTNILKEVERRTGIPYFKSSQEHGNFLRGQDRFVNELRYADPRVVDMLYQTGLSILIDRGFMCEWVYAQFFNRETDLEMLRKIDAEYARLGAKILICTRKSFEGIKDDLDPRLDSSALQKISALYGDFVNWTKCSTYVLYVDDENLQREVEEVLRFINE